MKPSEIVDYIERKLKEKGLPKSDFYEATGISAAVFSNWRKEKNRPSLDNLDAINAYLGTTFAIEVEDKKMPRPNGRANRTYYDSVSESSRSKEESCSIFSRYSRRTVLIFGSCNAIKNRYSSAVNSISTMTPPSFEIMVT